MATLKEPPNELAQFSCVVTQKLPTPLSSHPTTDRDEGALLRKVQEIRDDYVIKETTRKATIAELEKAQQQQQTPKSSSTKRPVKHTNCTQADGIPTKLSLPLSSDTSNFKLVSLRSGVERICGLLSQERIRHDCWEERESNKELTGLALD